MAFSQRALTEASTLARSAVSPMKQLLLDTALSIEESRATSLANFLGAGRWSGSAHLESLQSTHRALAECVSEASRAGEMEAYNAKPMRILDGPVRYGVIQDLPKDDREFLEEKLFSHHGAPPQMLANLADSERTIWEITARMSLDFQRLFAVADIERAVSLLEQVGYLETAH